jgi:hypothetical protein
VEFRRRDAGTHAVSSGWELKSGGRSGSCWFTGPDGYSALTLTDVFVPDASSCAHLLDAIPAGHGDFPGRGLQRRRRNLHQPCSSGTTRPSLSWQSYTVDLGAFAGKQIQIRFELTSDGAYYPDTGGVWLDDLSITSGTWLRWSPFAEDSTLAARRFTEQRTVFDNCADFSNLETIVHCRIQRLGRQHQQTVWTTASTSRRAVMGTANTI